MDFETIKAWLAGQTAKQLRIRSSLAVLSLILAPVALAISLIMAFAIAWLFVHDPKDPGVETRCFWISLGALPVLFIVNRFMPREKKEQYYHEDADTSLVGSYIERRKTQLRFISWLLFTGPRAVDWVISCFRKIHGLKRQDTHSCAAVLWLLMVKGKRVPYADIQRELEWVDLDATLPQLASLNGVLNIKAPVPAMSLSEDLRAAIRTGAAAG